MGVSLGVDQNLENIESNRYGGFVDLTSYCEIAYRLGDVRSF